MYIYSTAALWMLTAVAVSALMMSDRSTLGFDLELLLDAARSMLDGVSPYSTSNVVPYPPLAAWLVSPLLLVPQHAAHILGALLSLAAIAGALRVLGVRDSRCYALALLAAPTMLGAQLGNISALVTLLAAVAWRYRSGTAVGASVALKLLTWPLVLWLVAIGRTRSALAAVASAVILVFGSWATIGFAGMQRWPSIVHAISKGNSGASFSLAGSFRGAGLIAALLTVGCLAACWQLGRSGDHMRSFTLAIAASLLASPIVWGFYFTLLFVPIAIRQPRLHPIWTAPLLFWLFPASVYPPGWARAGTLLVTTAILAALVQKPSGATRFDPAKAVRQS